MAVDHREKGKGLGNQGGLLLQFVRNKGKGELVIGYGQQGKRGIVEQSGGEERDLGLRFHILSL